MSILRRHATSIVLLVLFFGGIVVLTRDTRGLRGVDTLPVGMDTVEQTGSLPTFIWWESFDRYYIESFDESGFAMHQLNSGSEVTLWQSGNVFDTSWLDPLLADPTDEQLAAIGFATVPVSVSVDERSLPHGALIPPGLLASDYRLDGTVMSRPDEILVFTDDGIPLSGVFYAPDGRVITTRISFEPGVTAGDVVPGCTALSPIAQDIIARYPPIGCD